MASDHNLSNELSANGARRFEELATIFVVFAPGRALDLDLVALAGSVRIILPLRDNPFEKMLLAGGEELFRIGENIGILQPIATRTSEKLGELRDHKGCGTIGRQRRCPSCRGWSRFVAPWLGVSGSVAAKHGVSRLSAE